MRITASPLHLSSWNFTGTLPMSYDMPSLNKAYQSPTGETGGTIGFLAVCQSVCPSIPPPFCLSIHLSVRSLNVPPLGFPDFSQLSFEILTWIWYMNLSCHNTDQVWLLLLLTYFYLIHCPLQKFRFPDFSLPTFVILTWNLVYEFVLT